MWREGEVVRKGREILPSRVGSVRTANDPRSHGLEPSRLWTNSLPHLRDEVPGVQLP
jgi:hypothetical protein